MPTKRISLTNLQVKHNMYLALMKLLECKSISAITVSDLTKDAGVSRMSFYRNYSEIEDILVEHLNEVVEEYKLEDKNDQSTEIEEYLAKENMIRCFNFFYQHHAFIDILISCGMGDLFLAKITEYLVEKWIGDKSDSREAVLKICAYAGSIYNMYREWNKGSFKENPEEIAAILFELQKN